MTNIQKANEFKALGNTAFQAGRYQQSIQHFTKAIQLNPNDHVFFSNRSGAYASLGQYEKALQDATSCVNIKPSWPKGYKRKGLAQFFLGQIDQAISTYKSGLSIDPNNAELKEDLKRAQEKKNEGENDADPNQLLKNPQNLQMFMKLLSNPQTKNYIGDPSFMSKVQALMKNPALFSTMAQQDPRLRKAFEVINTPDNNPDMQELLKNINKKGAQKKNEPKSEQPKTEQPQFKPEPPKQQKKQEPKKQEPKKQEKMEVENPAEALKNQGNAEFKKRNFERALQLYEQAINLSPQQVLYYNNKAAAYIQLGNLDKAIQEIKRAEVFIEDGKVKNYVKKAKIYSRKASILAKQQKYDLAIQWYGKSLVQDNNANVKEQLNKIKKIKKQYDAKAYINPQLAEKHCEEGNQKFKNGKFPEALKQYEEAIKRNPAVAKYHSNLGTTLIKLMDFVRARDALQTALKIDPNYTKAYSKKGDCHFFLKQYHKALDMYEKGLKIDPNNEACKLGMQKTQSAMFNSTDQEERSRHAMADPEIQAILKTPQIQNVLNDLQNDPKAAQKAFQNPDIAAKLQKLIAAGVLRTS